MARSSEPGRTAASRLFAVLYSFSRSRPILSLTEVSAIAGLPVATAYRILQELAASGAVERLPGGKYQIGLRLWEIGSLAPRQRDLRRIARSVMQSLHEATNETVQLAVPKAEGALVVEKISGTRTASNVTEVAGVLPFHATAVGKIFLGFGPEELIEQMSNRALRKFTPFTSTDWAALVEERLTIRREHVAYSREELTLGTASVAAPIFDVTGDVVASIGILTSSTMALARLTPSVRVASLSVSERIGYRSEEREGAEGSPGLH